MSERPLPRGRYESYKRRNLEKYEGSVQETFETGVSERVGEL
jgi:hypothetical protein